MASAARAQRTSPTIRRTQLRAAPPGARVNPVPPMEHLMRSSGNIANPIVSAVQFANLAEQTGGATMHLRSNQVVTPGHPGYMVGGEQDSAGRRVPTAYHPGALSAGDVLRHQQRLRSATRAPEAAMGSWRDTEASGSPHEVDLSAIYQNRTKAERIGRRRGEKAIWDNSRMDEIRLDH